MVTRPGSKQTLRLKILIQKNDALGSSGSEKSMHLGIAVRNLLFIKDLDFSIFGSLKDKHIKWKPRAPRINRCHQFLWQLENKLLFLYLDVE